MLKLTLGVRPAELPRAPMNPTAHQLLAAASPPLPALDVGAPASPAGGKSPSAFQGALFPSLCRLVTKAVCLGMGGLWCQWWFFAGCYAQVVSLMQLMLLKSLTWYWRAEGLKNSGMERRHDGWHWKCRKEGEVFVALHFCGRGCTVLTQELLCRKANL